MIRIKGFFYATFIAFCLFTTSAPDASTLAAPSEADTIEAYSSRNNILFSFPRHIWNFLAYPIGEFALFAEHSRLPARALDLFMNDARTFGIFPQIQLGGETGTGGGLRFFHSNLGNRHKHVEGMFIYSGSRGQVGQIAYFDPSLFGSRMFYRLDGGLLRTQNQNASVNSAVRSDPNRNFQISQIDALFTLGWSKHVGPLAATYPNTQLETFFGYYYRDFNVKKGGTGAVSDHGSTRRASALPGIGQKLAYISVGGRLTLDNRDYRAPIRTAPHPWLGNLPGEVVTFSNGQYHFYRNTTYARRGGMLAIGGEYASGPDFVRFVRTSAEIQGFLSLFRAGQILAVRSRFERIFRLNGGIAPYVDLIQLGGGNDMRGFRRGFFRGEGSLLVNIEYRYLIWDTWNAFFFWDEGQVFDTFDEFTWQDFHTTIGGGLTFRTPTGLIAKIQIGYSFAEKPLFGFAFTQDF